MKNKIKISGFIAIELHTGILLLVMLLFCFAVSMNGFARVNDYHLVKQRCIAAAQAQLDSIELTGTELSKKQFESLWPKIDCFIEQTSPTDQWKGTKLIKVSTGADSFNHKVKIELCRYIPEKQN